MTMHEFQMTVIGVVLFAGAITCAAFMAWLSALIVVNIRDRLFRSRVEKSLWADFLKFRESPEGMHKTLGKLDKTS